MPNDTKLWVVLADGAHARIVTRGKTAPGAAPGYVLVTEFDSVDAHHLTRDIMSGKPGRVYESGYSGHHAVQPRTDPHQAAKLKFMHTLADYINAAGAKNDYDELILFAPAHCLHELRECLDAGARRKVTHEAARDLTKLPFAELQAHIEKLPG